VTAVSNAKINDFSEEKAKVDKSIKKAVSPSKNEKLDVETQIKIKCQEYGIPFDVVLAIARLETGHFSSDAYLYGNNVGGLSVDEVLMTFTTLEEGVECFVENLATYYFDQGLTTPEEIGKKYCPCNDNWARTVEQIMEEQNRHE